MVKTILLLLLLQVNIPKRQCTLDHRKGATRLSDLMVCFYNHVGPDAWYKKRSTHWINSNNYIARYGPCLRACVTAPRGGCFS